MKRLFLNIVAALSLGAVALSLGACTNNPFKDIGTVVAAAQNFTVTQGQVDAARNSYNGFVLAPLVKYARLPRCKTGQTLTLNDPCHDRKLLKQIREVDKRVAIAFTDTQNRIISGDNKGAAAAYNSLMNLIDIAKSMINQTGVAVLGV